VTAIGRSETASDPWLSSKALEGRLLSQGRKDAEKTNTMTRYKVFFFAPLREIGL